MKARQTVWLVGLLLANLCACVIKADIEDSKKSKEDIRASLGVESDVLFHSYNDISGSRLLVDVRVKSPPPADAAKFKADVTEIVRRDFRSRVDRVTVAY
jgi:hypothetical protein